MNHNIEIRNLSHFNDISLLKKLYDLNQANVPEVGSVKTLSDFIDLLVLSDDILLSYVDNQITGCLLYTSPSPRDAHESRMPSSA